ncbi:MAG: hypothetical protein M1817_003928 [Caeruleum heppii]|nr:MAG: hypothetical protein M1817_003928 [Caeruleum heppii]
MFDPLLEELRDLRGQYNRGRSPDGKGREEILQILTENTRELVKQVTAFYAAGTTRELLYTIALSLKQIAADVKKLEQATQDRDGSSGLSASSNGKARHQDIRDGIRI